MKKILCMLLLVVLAFSFVSCKEEPAAPGEDNVPPQGDNPTPTPGNGTADALTKSEGVMTYAQYMAAELGTVVTVEAYVQAHQDWWDNKVSVYAADPDGAYFFYEMTCSEENAAKLIPGTKIRVTGTKTAWAGEVEIDSGATFEFAGEHTWIADAKDITDKLATDELINYQNQKVVFKGITVTDVKFKGDIPGDDIYLHVTYGGAEYEFCVERYLTDENTQVYKDVSALQAGDIIDVEGFAYWYSGLNTHVTGVTKTGSVTKKSEGVMTYAQYLAAEDGDAVVVEVFVQDHQAWWDNKISVYAADMDGAYFLYELTCSEEDAAKLTPGTKIKVTGYRTTWSGENEVDSGATFEFAGDDKYIAPIKDVTDKLGTDDLINYQNQKVVFRGLTVAGVRFKGDNPGDDIYLDITYGGQTYEFCVEKYFTDENTQVYKDVSALQVGDVIDVECFAYWYNGINAHITAITVKK